MRGLIAICIVALGVIGCTDDTKTNDQPCEGQGCYLLGCSWVISDSHCADGFNGIEYAAWTETSTGCDNPEHDGVAMPGRTDCQEWETCEDVDGVAKCEIE